MMARQAYRAIFFAPLVLAALVAAPALLLLPSFCAEGANATACGWQIDLAKTLGGLLRNMDEVLTAASYLGVVVYCAFAALVGHFAFPRFFLHRACTALRMSIALGFAIMTISRAADAVSAWSGCTAEPEAAGCGGSAELLILYYITPAIWVIATLFLPLGIALSVTHGIVLGVIHGARDERRYS